MQPYKLLLCFNDTPLLAPLAPLPRALFFFFFFFFYLLFPLPTPSLFFIILGPLFCSNEVGKVPLSPYLFLPSFYPPQPWR